MTTPTVRQPDIARILDRYAQQAERLFRARAQAAGLHLTGELLESFQAEAARAAGEYVEARISMKAYARIKDLRRMNYARTPPLAVLESFVEQVGVDKFGYVPGYDSPGQSRKVVRPQSETQIIERIAWGIKMNRARFPNVERGYRGIYADPLRQELLPNLFTDLMQQAGLTALRQIRLLFSN